MYIWEPVVEERRVQSCIPNSSKDLLLLNVLWDSVNLQDKRTWDTEVIQADNVLGFFFRVYVFVQRG